jgi:anhydro-N-acetylmuramic acid kinase
MMLKSMKSKDNFKVIGVMSGTSLDGLDLAFCQFIKKGKWTFKLLSSVTLKYSARWKDVLSNAHKLSGADLLALDAAFGKFIGESCKRFCGKEKIKGVDLIASHGHTVFHQTHREFTFQLGNGNAIHVASGIPVVYDFRSLDVAYQGQGAPLVPVGDRYLFGEYDICLNLGGIANLSMEDRKKRIAYDICFANMGLNYLSAKNGKEFDSGGTLASQGRLDQRLLNQLAEAYDHLRATRPALGREGFESTMENLLDQESISLEDRMRTFCESIVLEIERSIPRRKKKLKLLVTGGGALNDALINLLKQKLTNQATVIIPERKIVEFKEAMVFGFLGVLRMRGEVNVLKSVTRAQRDTSSGVAVGW